MNEILNRAKQLGRELMRQFLSASVYRLAWSLPVGWVIGLGIIIFLLLVVFGGN